jgi:hypothetical protein
MNNQPPGHQTIQVSQSYRWIENGHIYLWLIKDTCWAMEWKMGGIFMILPTVAVAFYILWKSRMVRAELYHNIAVCLWILANSIWMIGEFFDGDTRPYAAGLFLIGLILLSFYYLFYFRKDNAKQEDYVLSIDEEPVVATQADTP